MDGEDRVILITGATGGLGRQTVREFAKRGARLVLVGTSTEKLTLLSRELALEDERILLHAADLTEPGAAAAIARQAVEKFGHIDVLLQLIGGWSGGQPVDELDDRRVEEMLQQHLWTTYHLVNAVLPVMRANRFGRILVVSSPAASHPVANAAPYVIGKAAQEALMLTVAQENKDSGITANILLVDTIDTEHARDRRPAPNNRNWTTVEEITAALLYLSSDEARMINGARIPLYGA